MIKKFEAFDEEKWKESFEDLETDVELLMQDLISTLNLKKIPNIEDWSPVNGYYSNHAIKHNDSIVYSFILEDPFDTSATNNSMMVNTIEKATFVKDLVEELAKITSRLDKFGYKWQLNHYNGDNQLALYVSNKKN